MAPAWTERELRAAVDHGLQREAFSRVRSRLTELRAARGWREIYNLQAELLRDVLWAQEYKSRSRRYLLRAAKGKTIPEEPESGSWELEHRIASRVECQLRSVGDCLAWKLLGCQRQVFWVLSQNANPGSIYGKAGLEAEASRIDAHWARGHFALMNDLTLSVRIGDLIVFTPDGPRLDEVKTDPTRQRSRQRERIGRALETLNGRLQLDVSGSPHELFQAQAQIKTRMNNLASALTTAKETGFGSSVIRPGWAVIAVTLVPRNPAKGIDDNEWIRAVGEVKLRAGLAAVEHLLQSMWSWKAWDLRDPLVGGVPFGAYPLDPEACAELTCGYSMYRTFASADLIDKALQARGFETRWHLARANDDVDPSANVLSVARRAADGMRGISVPASALNQVLYELVEPDRYAEALREMFDWSLAHFPRQRFAGQPIVELARSTLAFSNEKAVWFRKRSG